MEFICISTVNISRKQLFILYRFPDANDDSTQFLIQANNRSEWMWKMYKLCILYGFAVFIAVASTISIFLGWFIEGSFVSTYLYRPFMAV